MPTRLLACLLVVFAVAPASALAKEAPCNFPDCFVGDEVEAADVFRGHGITLEVFTVGRVDHALTVLYRVVRPGTDRSLLATAFVVDKKDGTGTSFRLYPAPGYPRVTLSGALSDAGTATVVFEAGDAAVELKRDGRATRRARRRAMRKRVTRQYRLQLTRERLDEVISDTRVQMSKVASDMADACSIQVPVVVDTSQLSARKLLGKDLNDMPFRCADIAGALTQLCARGPQWRSAALEKVKQVTCRFRPRGRSSASWASRGEVVIDVSLSATRGGRNAFNGMRYFETLLK